MPNVVSFMRAQGLPELGFGPAALISSVAGYRAGAEDLRWMKENAELLRCLASCDVTVAPDVLHEKYGAFVENLPQRLAFFPQYYRFFLHMACDLHALGMPGVEPATLARVALASGAPQAELSDLQRAERDWLLRRAGVETGVDARKTRQRLAEAVADPRAFVLPNRKASYELTHIAFYVSDYGKDQSDIPTGLDQSLRNVGILAWLEQNLDLLAECCIALDQIGSTVPLLWSERLAGALPAYRLRPSAEAGPVDGYHSWLMVLWSQLHHCPAALQRPYPEQGFTVLDPPVETGALRALSRVLLGRDPQETGSWLSIKDEVSSGFGSEISAIVDRAACSIPEFPEFFEGFARYNLRMSVA